MWNIARGFLRDEHGNAVADWLVLTVSIATIGFIVGTIITNGSAAVASDINLSLELIEKDMLKGTSGTTLLGFMPRG